MPYADLQKHIANLEKEGLLVRIRRPINKDTELHPLFRWQFRGGLAESERRAFFFENVIDSSGRRYPMPVVIGALGASPKIYEIAMGIPLDEIPQRWQDAIAHPVEPMIMEDGPVHEVVVTGSALDQTGGGLLRISDSDFHSRIRQCALHDLLAFYTKDPETGHSQPGKLQRPTQRSEGRRTRCRSASRTSTSIREKSKLIGKHLPAALVIGAPPIVSHCTVLKAAYGVDELGIARPGQRAH